MIVMVNNYFFLTKKGSKEYMEMIVTVNNYFFLTKTGSKEYIENDSNVKYSYQRYFFMS